MNKKNRKSISRKEFTSKHHELAGKIAKIKKTIKALIKEARPLAKIAEKVRDRGETLYINGPKKSTVPSFKTLPKMMSDLDAWATLDYDIRLLIESL